MSTTVFLVVDLCDKFSIQKLIYHWDTVQRWMSATRLLTRMNNFLSLINIMVSISPQWIINEHLFTVNLVWAKKNEIISSLSRLKRNNKKLELFDELKTCLVTRKWLLYVRGGENLCNDILRNFVLFQNFTFFFRERKKVVDEPNFKVYVLVNVNPSLCRLCK